MRRKYLAKYLVVTAIVSTVIGCSGDTAGIAPALAPTMYGGLVLNHHAINMSLTAPSNTMQLTATAVTADGALLPGLGAVTFRAKDSSVTVSASGVLTAHYATVSGEDTVIASLQVDDVTYADTALVRVTPTALPAPIAGLSVQSGSGEDEDRVEVSRSFYFPVVSATDVTHADVPLSVASSVENASGANTIYWVESSDPTVASVNRVNSSVEFADTGHVTLRASAWVYGVVVQDSIKLVIDWPGERALRVFSATPFAVNFPRVYTSVGTSVTWVYFPAPDANGDYVLTGSRMDIVFDDPAAVDSAVSALVPNYSGRGNIQFAPSDTIQRAARRFHTPGTYHWYNPLHPEQAGTVVVKEHLQ